jgi:hypothetical protein
LLALHRWFSQQFALAKAKMFTRVCTAYAKACRLLKKVENYSVKSPVALFCTGFCSGTVAGSELNCARQSLHLAFL